MARVAALLRRTEDDGTLLTDILSFNKDELIIDYKNYVVKRHGLEVNLTPNEYKILMTMAKYPKKAFTREELVAPCLRQ